MKTILLSLLALIVYSCVPKATEKNALCGTNQAFNSVTRTCYSVAEIRYKPVANLSQVSTTQESNTEVELTYTDQNNDKVISCAISSVNSNINVVSPVLQNGTMIAKMADLSDSLNNLKNALVNYNTNYPSSAAGTAATNATTDLATAATYSSLVSSSFYLPTIESAIANYITTATHLISQGSGFTTDTAVKYFYDLSNTRLTDVQTYYSSIANKCFCSGGKCTSFVIAKKDFSGTAGFSYKVTDVDGDSNVKAVNVTVTAYSRAINYYLPVVEPTYVAGTESYTSVASGYSFTLGAARDYFSTTSFTYRPTGTFVSSGPYVVSDSGLGKVSGCVNTNGTLNPSATCIYTPNSGDVFDALVPSTATIDIGDLRFTALSNGVAGNNIKIYYKDLATDITSIDPYASSTFQKYGMIQNTDETYLRVIGNNIYVIFSNNNKPTAGALKTLINADKKAKTLVSVDIKPLGSSSTLVSTSEASSGISLAGGVSGYDNFSYTVSNAYGTSTNTASAAIHITSVVDYPVLNSVVTNSKTVFENTSSQSPSATLVTVDLTNNYSATDGVINTPTAGGCNIVDTSVGSQLSNAAPTCTCTANSCIATLYPKPNVSGPAPFPFTYQICSSSGCSSTATYYIYLTPVNDQPSATGIAAAPTILENSTAAPSNLTFDITTAPGGAGFEDSQTVTVTATSSNQTVVPNANIVITVPDSAHPEIKHVVITPVQNQSAAAPITITYKVQDNGQTSNCTAVFPAGEACDTKLYTQSLTITPVNDPPYITSTATFPAQSNEGGYIVVGPFKVDEDQANSADEDADPITLDIKSDNQTVLMDSNISIFYDLNDNGVEDASESRANNVMLETAAGNDSALHNFYLKLTPVGGTSGSANVTIKATDSTATGPAKSSTYTFSFVVNPVAGIHGGWSNISATGIKTDKFGAPANPTNINCNYNKSSDTNKCTSSSGSGDCTGTSSPYGNVTTTAANVLYWDSNHQSCFYSYANPVVGATPAFLWKQFNTACPVTRTSSICSGENCISNGALAAAPTAIDQYYYNTATRECIKSQLNGSVYSWNTAQPYYPSMVTLSWNAFSLTGSGTDLINSIKGYNVYRREARKDYDYKKGYLVNTTYGDSTASLLLSKTSILTFIDKTAEAGKVYYYTVRPIDTNHNFATYTPEVYSEIRVVAPPRNYAFVHRWMINQEICSKMHMTISNGKVDPSKSFRCAYNGPGAKLSSGNYYYDYGQDLLVDTAEIGCPYTLNTNGGHCSNGTNGCVGIGDPTIAAISGYVNGDIYYDRDGGKCYIYKGASSAWFEMDDTTNVTSALFNTPIAAAASYDPYNTSLNAPMANIKNASAATLCGYRQAPTVYNYSTTTMALANMSLPEKKDYIAYSAAPITASDAVIADTEQGDSLNVQSRCNSSGASGLTNYFTDSDLPTSSTIYTLPGTASSGIRSLYTGSIPWGYSYGTEACVSRYGIQDLYGNVAEWTKDKISCANDTTRICTAVAGTNLYYDFNGNSEYYGFNLLTGPFNDTNGSGMAGDTSPAKDSYLTSWAFEEESFDATKFNFPLAMPMYTNFSSFISCNYTKAGTCNVSGLGCQGTADPTGIVTGANGERYLDHSSGKCYQSSGGTTWTDITTSLTTPAIAGVNYLLDIGSTNGITYSELHGDGFIVNGANIYADPSNQGAFAVGGSYLSTSKAGRYSAELVPLASKRSDIGFRCMVPIPYTQYDAGDTFHHYNYNY